MFKDFEACAVRDGLIEATGLAQAGRRRLLDSWERPAIDCSPELAAYTRRMGSPRRTVPP